MRLLIQRVQEASVSINGRLHSAINKGLLVLVGIGPAPTLAQLEKLAHKLVHLRIFTDAGGKMNLSVQEVQGQLLMVSQFTLYASVHKGLRPSYAQAAPPALAREWYEKLVTHIQEKYALQVETGVFGADMQVQLINDGPVTIWMDANEL